MQNQSKETGASASQDLNSGSGNLSKDSIDPTTPSPLNANIDDDLRLISKITGKYWSDEPHIVENSVSVTDQLCIHDAAVHDTEEHDRDDGFTAILSKSKKKKN